MARRLGIATIAAMLIVAVALLASWVRSGPRPTGRERPAAPDSAPTFAGRDACAECHVEQTRRWTDSHHDLAMQVADERAVLGDFDDATLTYAGTTSRFSRRDGSFVVATDGPDGTVHDYEIAYTFGVAPLQQYLVALPGGRLQALGLAWDARPAGEGGGRWRHLYPDASVTADDALHWTRTSQNWNDRCAACHSTDLRKRYDPATGRYATTWAELDVSCEACHGPGSEHAARMRAAAPPPAAGLVVRFPPRPVWTFAGGASTARAAGSPAAGTEVAACAPCHSHRSDLGGEPAAGETYLDRYEPSLLEEELYFADGQIQSEVYEYGSFVQSRMYAAGVTCSDCHDPHGLELRAEGNALCGRCHRAEVFDDPAHHGHSAGSPGARCVACHMPARTYMEVDTRHDHSFRVPRPDLSERLGVPNACQECHADRPATWAAAVLGARGASRIGTPHYGDAIAAGRRSATSAAPMLIALADDPTAPAIARATALALLARTHDPRALPALERAAAAADPLVRLGALRGLEGRDPAAVLRTAQPHLRDPRRALRLAAARTLLAVPPEARAAADGEDFRRALAEREAALAAHGDRPEALTALGHQHVALGRIADAERSLREAIRIAPHFVPAHVNLADLYRAHDRDAEAEPLLREALARTPDAAVLHHALGLLLVRRGQVPAALAALTRAAELAPDEPRYAYVLGIALHETGDDARALEVLRAARRRASGDADVLLALATISRDRGELNAARTYANALVALAPWDADAHALRDTLGGP